MIDTWDEKRKTFSPNALPSSITRDIFLTYKISGSDSGRMEIWDCDLSGSERINLATMKVTFKIPKKMDLKEKVIDALRNEKEEILASTHKKITELDEKINSLLALEYKP